MNRKWFLTIIIPLFIGCVSMTDDWKELDLGAFKISVPKNWKYEDPGEQEDSFVGQITGPQLQLFFDCSDMGYANSLLPTEQEYLKKNEWDHGGFFYKVGVTYTADFNVKNEISAQMKKLGTSDSSLVHVEEDPSYKTKTNLRIPSASQKIKYPKADYIADMTYKDSTIFVPIEIPVGIKMHHIQVDTTKSYIIKTIWPKVPGMGMTGIYIHSRSSAFNFQVNGKNLSANNQSLALKAFKTIKIK